jgi:hypothetical protein
MGLAVNCDPSNAKLKAGRDLGQRCRGAFSTRQAVGDNSDMVAPFGLSIGKIQDVAEDSANRRAHRVQDTKRLI